MNEYQKEWMTLIAVIVGFILLVLYIRKRLFWRKQRKKFLALYGDVPLADLRAVMGMDYDNVYDEPLIPDENDSNEPNEWDVYMEKEIEELESVMSGHDLY